MPFVFACIHLAFAFPMIERILRLFNLNNVWLFAFATIISVAVFALLLHSCVQACLKRLLCHSQRREGGKCVRVCPETHKSGIQPLF